MLILDRVKRRLKSRRGESITEVLAALLVSTIGVALLTVMIGSSSRMISTSRDKIDDYVGASNLLAQKGTDNDGEGTVVVRNTSGDAISLSDDVPTREITVAYYTNSELGEQSVTAYKVK